MEEKRQCIGFGFADAIMPDGTPVYIRTRKSENPFSPQLQIYTSLFRSSSSNLDAIISRNRNA